MDFPTASFVLVTLFICMYFCIVIRPMTEKTNCVIQKIQKYNER